MNMLQPSWKDAYYHLLPPAIFPACIEHGLIHIHIPKTAGTSIRIALFGSHVVKHVAAQEVDAHLWNTLTSFSVVRDPVSRFLSSYKYHCRSGYRGNLLRKHPGLQRMSLPQYCDTFLNQEAKLLAPQVSYLYRSDADKTRVDHILLFDDLEQDFNALCAKLGLDIQLSKTKTTEEIHVDLDPSIRKRIEEFYSADFDLYTSISDGAKEI